jgi:hypothetical protein
LKKDRQCNGRKFEDTKGIIRIRKSKKDRQQNDQKKKDKQRSTKHYTEYLRLSNTNTTKNWGMNSDILMGKQWYKIPVNNTYLAPEQKYYNQGSNCFQIRGRSDSFFKELIRRSGRQQREVGRLLGVINCLIKTV